MDIIASAINFVAVRYALMPADEDHPFGHTKAEGIAALLQSAFILGSTALLLLQVVERFLHPRAIEGVQESIGIMGFSVVATTLLVLYQRYVWKKKIGRSEERRVGKEGTCESYASPSTKSTHTDTLS